MPKHPLENEIGMAPERSEGQSHSEEASASQGREPRVFGTIIRACLSADSRLIFPHRQLCVDLFVELDENLNDDEKACATNGKSANAGNALHNNWKHSNNT